MIEYISFFLMFIYIILSDFLQDIDRWIYILIVSILLLLSFSLMLLSNIHMNEKIISIIIFIIIAIPTIIDKILKINKDDNKKDDDKKDDDKKDDNKKDDDKNTFALNPINSISITLFLIVGFIAHHINYVHGEPCGTGNNELLCSSMFILIFAFMNYAILNVYKTFKDYKVWPYNDEESTKGYIKYVNMLILCIWQLYIYILIDGFDASDFTQSKLSGGSKSGMYKIFSYISIFLLSMIFISNIIGLQICNNKSGYINDIKELQLNLLTSTVFTLVIVFSLPN